MAKESYPYIPGTGGIEMHKILAAGGDAVISGASNRPLRYIVSQYYIHISDIVHPEYYLEALVDSDRDICFGMRTKVMEPNDDIKTIQGRHPDLHGGKFIDVAFDYFEERRLFIRACMSTWRQDSDNYKKFQDLKRTGLDNVQAAKGTWSAQQFLRHGFGQIGDNDISINVRRRDPSIIALFHRG